MKSTTTLYDKNGAKPERASLEISVLGQNSNCLRGLLRYTQTDQLTWMPFCEVTTSSSREGRTQKAACKQKTRDLCSNELILQYYVESGFATTLAKNALHVRITYFYDKYCSNVTRPHTSRTQHLR